MLGSRTGSPPVYTSARHRNYPDLPISDSEETPLIPSTHERRTNNDKVWLSILFHIAIFAFSASVLLLWSQSLREGVVVEKEHWQQELAARRLEEQIRIDEWEREFSAIKELNRQQVERWEQELEKRHLDEDSRIKEWEREFNAKREQHRRQVERWELELEGRRLEEQSRIDKWERAFNATRERNRRQMEKWQREEEEMERLGLHWGQPIVDSHCTGYNTREYRARLLNTVPYNYNWLKPCEDVPIVIHGRSIKTSRCEVDPSTPGEVVGYWSVNFDETLCTPFWDQFEDKGCTAEGSGRHRFLAHLVNIHDGEDGEKLCASTPIDFHGRHFDSPHSCVNWGRTGIYGFWEIEDSNC